jgi:hypothetical protein
MDRCRSTLREGVFRQLQTVVNSNQLLNYTDLIGQHQEPAGAELGLSQFEDLINSREDDEVENLRRAHTSAIDLVTRLAIDESAARGQCCPDTGHEKTIAWLLKLLDV